ncbi:thiamine diphosphokinase [Litoreibacter roseus]|uniref:Thiamine diphosphokinase n=1 Tax=Litoreibacter roseus TaxID=2601869 RepID=A0A6N6JJ01_9RHOB|nr:thiamine diphosphokinase [Litoreibacter roseus]GFE65927.1 thiamine pyrophosphokinase [Litoreibacter roseus]
MYDKIVQTDMFLTLLGGAPTQSCHVQQVIDIAPILVAADGGADTALKAGHTPRAVIGDMDSISPDAKLKIPSEALHFIAEQDSTDFEKCLRRITAPLILAVGFTGARLDHELAVCTALVRHPEQTCVLVGDTDICFLAPLTFEIDLPMGTRFSLFPMGQVKGQGEGLKYDITGLSFAPWSQIGTSNETTGLVKLSFDQRFMLVLLPRAYLGAVIKALVPDAIP